VFWHNLARITWSAAERDDGDVVITHRKSNRYRRLGRLVIPWSWSREGDGLPASHALEEIAYASSTEERLLDALGAAWLTVAEIKATTDQDGMGDELTEAAIGKALTRGAKRIPPRFETDAPGRGRSGRWHAIGSELTVRMVSNAPTSEATDG
jgi:hypothetical protein